MRVLRKHPEWVEQAKKLGLEVNGLESLQHIFDSKLQAGMLLNKRCKELGLKFNKVKKIYEAA